MALQAAFQGERGAFSEAAAGRLLGPDVVPVPYRTFEEVFEAVSNGGADCAIVPIENSLAGSVHRNYDLLVEHDLTILGETNLRIVHNLVAPPGTALEDVRRVFSHPVALAQCEKFLRAHPSLEIVPAYDTAGSVKMVIEARRRDEAAIASAAAASLYGAHVLVAGIEDNTANYTRFLLLARPDRAPTIAPQGAGGGRKTSIFFRLRNRPSALFRALAAFALRDVDLSKIESRPIEGRPFEYSFYLDFLGDAADPVVGRALDNLAEMAESIRVLGSYPRAESEDMEKPQ